MKSIFLPDGVQFMLEMLAGSTKRINGLYVEYASEDVTSVESRDLNYFDELLRSPSSGYARIPIQAAYAHDGVVTFRGLVAKSDFKGGHIGRKSRIIGATLVYMPDDLTVNDKLLYTTLFTNPVKITKGAYTDVSITLSIGA